MAVQPHVVAFRADSVGREIGNTNAWPWHTVTAKTISLSLFARGERRLEAGTYLSEGHSLQQRFIGRPGISAWKKLGQIARVWQPSRLKGITVGRDYGTPFLAATQVFDARPVSRKWLSLDKTKGSDERFVTPGTILVTCSGSVGRATLAFVAHEKVLISHDLLRVDSNDESRAGWLYAFLRSSQGRAMMTGEKYGHMIKHLEPSHLENLPIPDVTDTQAEVFLRQTEEILEHRNAGHWLLSKAEALYATAIGPVPRAEEKEHGFRVPIGAFGSGRRRLEANYHNPAVAAILHQFGRAKVKVEPLGSVTDRIWMMDRFKRNYGPSGIPYLSADELFMINPEEQKRIVVTGRDSELYFAKPNWLLMARSGQVYGLNGSVYLVTDAHTETFFSDDLIRIRPKPGGPRAGYLTIALSHPTLGRPLLIREAYGTSIPHLDPPDVARFPLPRLGGKLEDEIADVAEAAAVERATADVKERNMADAAGEIISDFLATTRLKVVAG